MKKALSYVGGKLTRFICHPMTMATSLFIAIFYCLFKGNGDAALLGTMALMFYDDTVKANKQVDEWRECMLDVYETLKNFRKNLEQLKD